MCLARDCDVVVTGTSTGRIPWPRCRAFGTHGGGSGILLDDELARAVRCESALAIRFWWGGNSRTVAWWRRALGVTSTNNERSRQLLHAAAKAGAAAMRERGLTDDEKSVGECKVATSEAEGIKAAAREVERIVRGPEDLKRLLDQ
jgi:hypothetical protein